MAPNSPVSCRLKPSNVTRASWPSRTAHTPSTKISQSPNGPRPSVAALDVRSCGWLLLPALLLLLLLPPLLLLPLLPLLPPALLLLLSPAASCSPCRMPLTPTPGRALAASSACAPPLRVRYVPLLA